MLKDAERVNVVTLARKGDINLKLSGQIFHTQLLSVILSMYAWKVGGGLVFMAVSCRRMADRGWQVTVGMGWGQILGKYFSMNSFTSAISCERKCDFKKKTKTLTSEFANVTYILNRFFYLFWLKKWCIDRIPEDRSCEGPLHRIWRRPSVGRLWIGFFSTSCLQNAVGSWSPFHRDTAGWGGACGQRTPAEKAQVSSNGRLSPSSMKNH